MSYSIHESEKGSTSALSLDEQLCFPLYAAANATVRAYRPLLEPLGLTYPQYLVMLVLWERDGLKVTEIGKRLRLDTGTLTPLVKRLETAGLVSRARLAEDERCVAVTLTEAGKALREVARDVPAAMKRTLPLESDTVAALKAGLTHLIELSEALSARE
ncbi:DNA-binding MarR family transcriptional regulator [Pseudomonas duriflava]|uniref:DNA-binding MarR family transcriptional regulator n=1 Tax=Pseudomonas duriflava TaxID=459528 RepID=A0A562QHD2_9PSED|nr:MarR family transcriptional regulator [Pseudomonas duriflava]TWI55456.1 DNA-binding MarR family transcriptional regulator [Pseudomonas duriflava]